MVRRLLDDKKRKTKAVYFQQTVVNGRVARDAYGNPKFETGIEIDVFWVDILNEIVNESNEKVLSRAKVEVDRVMLTGDVLWEGLLASADIGNARANAGFGEIQRFERYRGVGGLRNKVPQFKYVAYL